jgi:hypothetical protein
MQTCSHRYVSAAGSLLRWTNLDSNELLQTYVLLFLYFACCRAYQVTTKQKKKSIEIRLNLRAHYVSSSFSMGQVPTTRLVIRPGQLLEMHSIGHFSYRWHGNYLPNWNKSNKCSLLRQTRLSKDNQHPLTAAVNLIWTTTE